MSRSSSEAPPQRKRSNVHTFEVKPQIPRTLQTLNVPNQRPIFRTISPQSFREGDTMPKCSSTVDDHRNLSVRPQYDDKIRFTNPKTTQHFTHRQEKSDEPPKKRQRTSKYPKDASTPTLSVRKPVGTAISTDAWVLILTRCDVKFLTCARLVCRTFHEILRKEYIWREAREASYPDRPSCPPGLSEMQYANLLSGRGCQIRPCTRENTRKIYWPFMLRMCEQCFSLRTQTVYNTSDEEPAYDRIYQQQPPEQTADIPPSFAGLLPSGFLWSGRYTGPRRLHSHGHKWQNDTGKFCVLSSEYEALKQDFHYAQSTDDFNFVAWARRKWKKTYEIMKIAIILDTFADESTSLSDLRKQKAEFFTQKAAELDPPMRPEILERMAAYRGAIETSNKASLRSWDVLRPKIDRPELRAQAERLLKWEEFPQEPDGPRAPDNVWDRLIARREGKLERPRRYNEEQKVIIEIGRKEFRKIIDTVHDEDLLLLFLDAVRRSYELLDDKPQGLNGDGGEGVYRLTLDDARMVVDDVLETQALEGTMRERVIFGSLKCLACWRPDYNKLFGFEELIRHIRRVHCKTVGIDLHYHRIAAPLDALPISSGRNLDPVPWCHIPWPKSFPALPRHRKAEPGMFWNPDEDVEHVKHPVEMESAFKNHAVREDMSIDANDRMANFCEAIRVMGETRLEAPAIVKIALEYANRRAADGGSKSPEKLGRILSVRNFHELKARVNEIMPGLNFRFMCGLCLKDLKSSYHARFTRYPVPPQKLIDHWMGKHEVEDTAPIQNLVHLPLEGELWRIMEEEDAKLQVEKSKVVTKGNQGSSEMHGQPDPRMQALLKVPSCVERFHELFLPSDRSLSSACESLSGEDIDIH